MEIPNFGDQYNLKWNNHLANFVQRFIEHQHGESLVDVTLSCEGQYIKTHKLILSACSDYFHSIFQVHSSLQHPIILLNGVRFTDLKYILHFMYHGEVKVVDKDLPHVLALGETLQIKGLSSVKLKDMPSEEAQPEIRQPPKKNQKKEQFRKEPSRLQPLLPKPSSIEVPPFVPIVDNGAPFDYSKHKSPKSTTSNQVIQPVIPIITSVTSEAVVSNPIVIAEDSSSNSSLKKDESPSTNSRNDQNESKCPVPKPLNAFMIFANEWRKKLTVEHPEENNKEISVRLGTMWRNLLPGTKNIYYREAKRAEEEYKLKYPDYISPSESTKRKADVLNDATNTPSPTTLVDPMEVVEIQEHIAVSDSD